MTISPDKLERYRDFVDPEHTGAPYDPRKGLERLMGVLSPDPKGAVLAAEGDDWYGGPSQLESRVFAFLKELGLPSSIWPIAQHSNWQYSELKDKRSGQIVDGSLVSLGAVVKKIEQNPFKSLYRRSLAGAELAVPLVQQAVNFVIKAKEYSERLKLQGKQPPKFDSMWRIIGAANSPTDQKRPLAIFDTIDFLVNHPGKLRQVDIHNGTQISIERLKTVLSSLGNCGIINFISPQTEQEGQPGRGWSVYSLVNPESVITLDPADIYQKIRNIKGSFRRPSLITKVIDYIKEHPDIEYERITLAKELNIPNIHVASISNILSFLTHLNILNRPNSGFQDNGERTMASANDLTYLFYNLVCTPANHIAKTLSPLPLRPWKGEELTIYLQNYNEERSNFGPQGGEDTRRVLLEVLSETEGEIMKLSHLVDLQRSRTGAELRSSSLRQQLKALIRSGLIEQPKPGYYRLVRK